MILDYFYNRTKKTMSISYITEKGAKRILDLNVERFKSYYSTPNGKYENWDGSKCDMRWTDKPGMFDIKTYFEEMPDHYKKLLMGKTSPKLYTFDIEIDINNDNEFPEPSEAKFPISTISIASPECNVIVLGTKDLGEGGDEKLQQDFEEYMKNTKFFMDLGMKMPYIKYVKFNDEGKMIEYFLKHIVAQVPVLAGWNSLLFDWQYIQNRVKGYFPNIPLSCCSKNWMMGGKNVVDMKGDKVRLNVPHHTLILDMMDVIEEFDMVVMPIKESLSLDYIAHESMGINKIKYNGTLYDLYHKDYQKYVFYNAIDSILVQLIDKRFKTLQNMYVQALYCKEKIESVFSKIAVSEALVFNDFYEHGIKIVDNYQEQERGSLVGAYVKKPLPGKHKFICCNDFASLYPTGIITCNLSFENFMGHDYTEEELEQFRKDPNYFVSVNNNVYKNDKDYSFRRIQAKLKANRNTGKYLAKQLEAEVITDIDHILKNRNTFIKKGNHPYAENLIKGMEEIGYEISNSQDLLDHDDNWIKEFRRKLKSEIEYQTAFEQGMKLLGNSMYGGSSHVAFFWFNIELANDITGEGRNLIHLMEKHIPEFWKDNWKGLKELHDMLGVEVDEKQAQKVLDKYGSFVEMVYGDTDSEFFNTKHRIKEADGTERIITIEDLYNENLKKNAGVSIKGHESVRTDSKVLNWSADKGLYYGDIERVIRHKVTKAKWRLKTKSGKEIIVTNDHSLIVFRDGKQLEVKPRDVKKTDKILIVK